ncbi:MAG: tetratricopeptide repeat protein [Nitrospinaceae bacterium]|nr:tetratricopeptide repeat protein [Nitrospinaceae bacterium]NIS83927.1 tetratricopeptide repeat protein [Nitrospinaceae bacterium]NIT80735.1 tetratricopeptide repeat protein [Nitrospinaceae bacterium]NIU95129.1 tetratricopeptide repeat protein [Nitrospinaceae bacterium]NIY13770.1 tetratricopeptide repeat protein [Nitrospinaceae bacterium]
MKRRTPGFGRGSIGGQRLFRVLAGGTLCLLLAACLGPDRQVVVWGEKVHPLAAEGVESMQAGDYEAALIAVNELLHRDPGNVDGLWIQGKIYIKQDRLGDARKSAEKALQADAFRGGPHAVLGEVYFRTSRFDAALEESRRALVANPKLPTPYRVIGEIYLRRGRLKESLPVLKQAVQLAPRDPEILQVLSAAYIKIKEYDRAHEVLKTAMDLDPSRPGLHFNLALVFTHRNEADRALRHIDEAERLYEEAKNHNWLAKARHLKRVITKKFKLRPEDILSQNSS